MWKEEEIKDRRGKRQGLEREEIATWDTPSESLCAITEMLSWIKVYLLFILTLCDFAFLRCTGPLVKCFVCLLHSPGCPALGETKSRRCAGTSLVILQGRHRM